MPGQPRAAALAAYLREEVEGQTRAEIVLDLIANGQPPREIAAGITVIYKGQPWSPDRRTLGAVLRKHWPTEYRDAYRDLAEPHVEDALEAIKNAPETREGIAKARELASMYRWLAAKRDPATFGDTPALAIQVNNPGQMFLQAVARPGVLPPAKTPALPPGDASSVSTAPNDETNEDATD